MPPFPWGTHIPPLPPDFHCSIPFWGAVGVLGGRWPGQEVHGHSRCPMLVLEGDSTTPGMDFTASPALSVNPTLTPSPTTPP